MTVSKEQLQQLRLLSICPAKLRKQLLQKISLKCIKAICQCCVNIINGNIPLNKKDKRFLSKHKHTLRQLSYKKIPFARKRQLVIQKGGFLNVLLPAALSVLTSLLNGKR